MSLQWLVAFVIVGWFSFWFALLALISQRNRIDALNEDLLLARINVQALMREIERVTGKPYSKPPFVKEEITPPENKRT